MQQHVRIRPHKEVRKEFAQWARLQKGYRIRTVSESEFGLPAILLRVIPEHLLDGALVDGRPYRSPLPDRAKGRVTLRRSGSGEAEVVVQRIETAPTPEPEHTEPEHTGLVKDELAFTQTPVVSQEPDSQEPNTPAPTKVSEPKREPVKKSAPQRTKPQSESESGTVSVKFGALPTESRKMSNQGVSPDGMLQGTNNH